MIEADLLHSRLRPGLLAATRTNEPAAPTLTRRHSATVDPDKQRVRCNLLCALGIDRYVGLAHEAELEQLCDLDPRAAVPSARNVTGADRAIEVGKTLGDGEQSG